PGDFYFLDERIGCEAEMNAGIAGAGITNRCRRHVPLRAAIGSGDANLCAESHAIAASADKVQENPVLAGCADIAKQLDGFIEAGDDDVDAAGVEDVSESGAAMSAGGLKARTRIGRDVEKL